MQRVAGSYLGLYVIIFPTAIAAVSSTLSHILWSYLSEALNHHRRLQALAVLVMGVEAAPILRLIREPRPTLASLMRVFMPGYRSG